MQWVCKVNYLPKNEKLSCKAHVRLLKKYLHTNPYASTKKEHDYIMSKRNYHAMMADEIIRTNKKVSKARRKEIYNSCFKNH